MATPIKKSKTENKKNKKQPEEESVAAAASVASKRRSTSITHSDDGTFASLSVILKQMFLLH